MKRIFLFVLSICILFSSCTKEAIKNPIRHICEDDVIIENNTASIAFDKTTALSMGIPEYEYDAVSDLIERANARFKTKAGMNVGGIEPDWTMDGALFLSFDQNNPDVNQYSKFYPTSFSNQDVGIEMTCMSSNQSEIIHRLLIYSQNDYEDLYPNDSHPYYYRVFDVVGPLTFVYQPNYSGRVAMIVFRCPSPYGYHSPILETE